MAEIKTRPATPEYRDNWDRIFGRTDEHCAEVLQTGFVAKCVPVLEYPDWCGPEYIGSIPIVGDAVYWAQSKRAEETGNA